MRSIVIALALAASIAAPLSAVAATPNTFTTPTNVRHQKHEQPATVFITFSNRSSQDRELQVGNQMFKIRYDQSKQFLMPVGSVVRVYSETNSKVNGQELMQVSETDADKTVVLQ